MTILLVWFGWAISPVLLATSIEISDYLVSDVDGNLILNATVNYELTSEVRDALANGVPMIFQVEARVLRKRRWWQDKSEISATRNSQIQYHALSKQYIVENLRTNTQETFPDLYSALQYAGSVRNLHLAETKELDSVKNYYVKVRSRLLTSKLPLPLRMRSYFSNDWRLDSEWVQWGL